MASFLQSIVVSAAVAANGTSGTLYTCPANSYALINVDLNGNTLSGVVVNIGGKVAVTAAGTNTPFSYPGVVVGPGQAVTIGSNPSSFNVAITGVQFTNST